MKKRMIVILALVLIMLPTLSQVPDFGRQDSDHIQHVLREDFEPATVSSIDLDVGTYDSGDIDSLTSVDSDTYRFY